MIREYMGMKPVVDGDAFIAETAVLIGDVEVGAKSSIWYGAVLRGDEEKITIGKGTSIQDNCVLHCDKGSVMTIGNNCTIGHGAIVHGATVGDNVLIGMGAVVLDGATIGSSSIIGAGAVVKERAVIEPYSMVVGIPGKVIKTISEEQKAALAVEAEYIALSQTYKDELKK